MGTGPVGTHAFDQDIDGVRTAVGGGIRYQHSRGDSRSHVQGHGIVGLAEARPDVILTHQSRATDALLGGLSDQHQGALPLIPALGHNPGCAHQAGHVHIVPAGMHHIDLIAVPIDLLRGGGIGQTGLFLHG